MIIENDNQTWIKWGYIIARSTKKDQRTYKQFQIQELQ